LGAERDGAGEGEDSEEAHGLRLVLVAGLDELFFREASVLIRIEADEAGRGIGFIGNVRNELLLAREAVRILAP
jgi:hypothetical protein